MRARDNPFSTDRVLRIRYRWRGESWSSLLTRLDSLGRRAAIIGPEGAGKTTLLEDFEPHLRGRGFEIITLRLTRETPDLPAGTLDELRASAGPHQFILLDGAEQLSPWKWWQFLRSVRRAGGLLITAHQPGLLPTLRECRTDETLLAEIIADLLREPAERHREVASRLFQAHRGNLRDALRELYDLWSARTTDPIHGAIAVADCLRDESAASPVLTGASHPMSR